MYVMIKQKKYGVQPVVNRMELEHNLYLMVEDITRKIESGDGLAMSGLSAILPSARNIKKLPNGRIDLATVDEQARLYGNSMRWLKQMDLSRFRRSADEQDNDDSDAAGMRV